MDFLQGKDLIDKNEDKLSAESIIKKKTLIFYYFTSYHCEPCRTFDVKLKCIYKTAVERKIHVIVIIVAQDFDKETMMLNFRSHYGDYLAIPFEDELIEVLKYNYGVTYIPYLIVVNQDGTVITKEGRSEIESTGVNALVTWLE